MVRQMVCQNCGPRPWHSPSGEWIFRTFFMNILRLLGGKHILARVHAITKLTSLSKEIVMYGRWELRYELRRRWFHRRIAITEIAMQIDRKLEEIDRLNKEIADLKKVEYPLVYESGSMNVGEL